MTAEEHHPSTGHGEESPSARGRAILDAMRRRAADVVGQAREAASSAAGKGRSVVRKGEPTTERAEGAPGGVVSGVTGRFKDAAEEARKAAHETEDTLWADYMRKTGRDRRDDT